MDKISLLIIISFSFIYCSCQHNNYWTTQELDNIQTQFQSKNYFELRKLLNNRNANGEHKILYYKAVMERAFNNPSKSNSYIDQYLDFKSSPDSLIAELQTMKMNNYLRLHNYKMALLAADEALREVNIPIELKNDIQNTRLIAKALKDIPPQKISKQGDSELILNGTHIYVSINDKQRDYAYDTGANYSILMRSEAEALNLQIKNIGIDVGTATGKILKGDVGIADSLTIGNMKFKNVIFLVFPDEILTFPGGFKIHGIIGFPVLEAMKELHFRNGKIIVPEDPRERTLQNLALQDLTPLISFKYKGDQLIGRFDTGANKTVLYQPFFQKYFASSVRPNSIDTVESGGIGGMVKFPVYPLENISLNIADTEIKLENIYAHTTTFSSEYYLYANIGLDALDGFDEYILNFEDMALIVK